MCVRSGARWVHCGPCRPRLSLSSVWESKASKFLRMPLVKVALLYSFLTVDKSNEKTWDHIQPCISPIISAFWPFPVCGTQQRQQKKKKTAEYTHSKMAYFEWGATFMCYMHWVKIWVACLYSCWWLCSSAACFMAQRRRLCKDLMVIAGLFFFVCVFVFFFTWDAFIMRKVLQSVM